MDKGHDEKANLAALYEASRKGCVSTLNTLIQRDALILNRVSLASGETPLHIATLLGHLEFTRVLVNKKPALAKEVDSLGRTPLHLASAEGHTEIVKALLQTNTDVCLAFDQDERIPLHLAAMRGRIKIIKELIIARRESIQVNLNGDSLLHLCVRNNHLDALKLLVELADCNELFNSKDELLNSKDHDGNSILHLAVIFKQMKAIKYLLSVTEIKREVNAMNKIGYTALDTLKACDICPRDLKCFEIENILKEAGGRRLMDLNSSLPLTPSVIGVDEAQPRCKKWWKYIRSSLAKRMKNQENWIEETRGTLMVVATVIATMAFQAVINPPGGVWQQSTTSALAGSNCNDANICEAGTAVLSYSHQSDYQYFLAVNTSSFIASVCVILLVISGFPLTSSFFIWFLTLAMALSVACITLTYIQALNLVTHYDVGDEDGDFSLGDFLLDIWIGVLLIVGAIHIIRPLYWMVKKLRNFIRKSTRGPTEDPTNV